MKNYRFVIACSFFLVVAFRASAQTTLSGDHLITGDLTVGSSGTTKKLVVSGSLGVGVTPSHLLDLSNSYVETDGSAYFKQLLMTGGVVGFDFSGTASPTGDPLIYCGRGIFVDALATTDALALRRDGEQWRIGPATGTGNANLFAFYSDTYGSTVLSLSNFGSIQAAGGAANETQSIAAIEGVTYGVKSVAIGEGTVAQAYQSFVIGRNNVIEGDEVEWIEEEPLFVVGNGTGESSDPAEVKNRNALTVYKNGKVRITKRQGDILMGVFGNPE